MSILLCLARHHQYSTTERIDSPSLKVARQKSAEPLASGCIEHLVWPTFLFDAALLGIGRVKDDDFMDARGDGFVIASDERLKVKIAPGIAAKRRNWM